MTAASRPWQAFYPKGVKPELDPPPYPHLAAFARDVAAGFGPRTAFTCVLPNGIAGSLTFAEVDRLSDAFAAFLREDAKLQPGDRVAVQVPNSLPYPVVAFGVFKAGCVLVNVNPLYTAEEMAHQLADASPKALVIIDLFANKLTRALRDIAVPTVVVTRVADLFPFLPRTLVGAVQRYLRREVPAVPVPHTAFAAAIAKGEAARKAGAPLERYVANVRQEDLACLQYTGGTTGVAKGAMLTHGNLLINAAQTVEMCGVSITRGTEAILTALPLYHIFAFTVNFLGFYWLAAENILVPSPRPISNLRKAFAKYPISWMTGVNTLFNALLNEPWFRDAPPPRLRNAVAGGMALHAAVAQRWREVTGTAVIEGYGLTETSPVLTFNPFGREKAESIGIPIPSTDIRIVDDTFREVPTGSPGELAARGPQVMAGYWHRPDETAKVMRDGWLLTGDIAVMDAEGYFRIVDRKKDMILVSGFNVYPNEVEDCLAKLPGVREAAVVGVPDGAAGEAVKAFVVRSDPALTAEAVRAHCRECLTGYKVPKYVEFRDELPKTPVGKILRKELRAAPAPA